MDDKHIDAEDTAKENDTKVVKLVPEDQSEKSEALAVQEIPFEEQLSNAVEQNKDMFYQGILKQADDKIKAQAKQLDEIQSQQVEFRDEIAIRCFVPLISLISDTDNYRKAASDSYRAADDFLRVREGGEVK